MVKSLAEASRGAEADTPFSAGFRVSPGARVNRRNGYREWPFGTHTGTIALAPPKLRSGSYFPGWLPECRRSVEGNLATVVAGSM
jgi:transposase-like protein